MKHSGTIRLPRSELDMRLSPSALSVYLCLYRHADAGSPEPPRQLIADECGIRDAGVEEAIRELCARGLICRR